MAFRKPKDDNMDLLQAATSIDADASETAETTITPRPGRSAIEAAVRTLIAAAGDDPAREGLRDTPARVARLRRMVFRLCRRSRRLSGARLR